VAEERLAVDPPRPGDPPLLVWSADSTHAVVVSDRGRAPNLAAVREIAFGIWNQGETAFDGEVWIDELRLAEGVRDAGWAGAAQAQLALGDVVETRVGFSSRGAFFRQLDESASFQTDQVLDVTGQARLERFMPASWGVEMPVRVRLEDVRRDPTFLPGSDVRADLLASLRDIGSRRRRVGVGLRKVTPARNPAVGWLVNGLGADVAWYDNRTSTITGRVEASGLDARVGLERRPEVREIDLVPDFAAPLVRWLLPESLEQRVIDARLRWAPESIELGTTWTRQESDLYRFESILESPRDTAVRALAAPREFLQTLAAIGLRPVTSLQADLTFQSTRDLLDPERAVVDPRLQAKLEAERAEVAGVDVGWETTRTLSTRIAWRPRSVAWLRHEVTWTSNYGDLRNPSFVRRTLAGADTVLTLERNARAERELAALFSWDPGALGRALGDPGVLGLLKPLTFTATEGLFSRFDRDPLRPALGYQFGWASREEFLLQGVSTAASLTDRELRQLRWGLALEGVDVDLNWARTRVGNLDARADRSLVSETWPDVRVSVDGWDPGAWSGGVLRRLAVAGGVQRTVSDLVFGGRAQRRGLDEWAVPADVSLGWRGGLTTAWRGRIDRGRGTDPTGDTERDRETHRVSLRSAFLPPFGMGRRGGVAQPVQLSVVLSYVAERECRVPAARTDCVPFVDQINRALSLTLDTRVGDLELGLQSTWTDRRSFIGQRRGSTLFQLGIFGQFLIEAGELARLAGPLR